MSNSVDQYHDQRSVSLDLGPNCLQRLSVDNKSCTSKERAKYFHKQVAQWATIAHLGASIMFGDTIIDDAQRQVF